MDNAGVQFREITGPSVWSAHSFKSKADFTTSAPDEMVRDLKEIVASGAFDGLALTDINDLGELVTLSVAGNAGITALPAGSHHSPPPSLPPQQPLPASSPCCCCCH